jgi:tartrate-resistant acid phosphatase type 5
MHRFLITFFACSHALHLLAAAPQLQVNLLGMGDWGNGSPAQKQVAKSMADFVRKSAVPFDGALLAGDNFYGRLTGTNDSRWRTDFETEYDAKTLKFPFFATAGNHDYEGNKLHIEMDYALQNPASRWKFPARWYRIDLPKGQPTLVTILMLDSNKDYLTYDWQAELKWIDNQLEDVDRDQKLHPAQKHWTIAVAHHPLFSNGQHGDIGPLQTSWGVPFKKHNLDFYLCGHDHDLQHLEIPDYTTSFVLTGGGGAGGRDMRRDNRGPFSKRINGFTHFKLTPQLATVDIVDLNGVLLHSFEKSPTGQTRVTVNSPSDKSTIHQLKSLMGLGDEDD